LDGAQSPFNVREFTFNAEQVTLAGGNGFPEVIAPAGSISWRNIPHATFMVYAFASATETNPEFAVSTFYMGAESGFPLAPDYASAANNTFNMRVVFNPANFDPPLPRGTYTIRIQAISPQNVPVRGMEPMVWGADSPISTQYLVVSVTTAPPIVGGGGGWQPPAQQQTPQEDPTEEEEIVEPVPPLAALPVYTVTPTLPDATVLSSATEAAASFAESAADRWGGTVQSRGTPIVVEITRDAPTAVTLIDMPEGFDVGMIIGGRVTMAVLENDGSLTPIPTRINADGNVVVMLSSSATLVPFVVTATFTDLRHVNQHVATEIERAASLLLVEGFGDGTFRPGEQVTVQQAVTMFLRASGIPVQWATAMRTGAEHNFIPMGMSPNVPMTRLQTAQMIVNALASLGVNIELTQEEVDYILTPFDDVDGLTPEQRAMLAITVRLGIFRGFGDGRLGIENILNRSQMASLAVRYQNVLLNV